MKKPCFVIIAIVLLIVNSQNIHAITVSNLYTINIETTNKTIEERNKLFLQAFEQLLLKLTADPGILLTTQIQTAHEQLDKYISSFSYKSNTIEVVFSEKMVDSLLKKANIPYLSKNRPTILLWLLIDTNEALN
jgi:hypothetical protein